MADMDFEVEQQDSFSPPPTSENLIVPTRHSPSPMEPSESIPDQVSPITSRSGAGDRLDRVDKKRKRRKKGKSTSGRRLYPTSDSPKKQISDGDAPYSPSQNNTFTPPQSPAHNRDNHSQVRYRNFNRRRFFPRRPQFSSRQHVSMIHQRNNVGPLQSYSSPNFPQRYQPRKMSPARDLARKSPEFKVNVSLPFLKNPFNHESSNVFQLHTNVEGDPSLFSFIARWIRHYQACAVLPLHQRCVFRECAHLDIILRAHLPFCKQISCEERFCRLYYPVSEHMKNCNVPDICRICARPDKLGNH